MRQPPSHDEFRGKKKIPHAPRHRAATTGRRVRLAKVRWPSAPTVRGAARNKVAFAASVLACLALAAISGGPGSVENRQVDTAAFNATDRADRTNRSYNRQGTAQDAVDEANKVLAPEVAKAMEEEARKAAEAKAAAEAKLAAEAQAADQARKANPTPVAGLSQAQMNNAKKIVEAGQAMGLPKRAFVIAVATSMQECNLYNLASTRLPESFNYYNEGSGSDHDSVGLFQQRPSSGWGTVAQIMDPTYAATAFYRALVTVAGWDTMELTYAAQRVQVSAYPTAYAKHEARAQAVVDTLVR
jgi:hypothetical protein